MSARGAFLDPADVERPRGELDLIPAQVEIASSHCLSPGLRTTPTPLLITPGICDRGNGVSG